MCSPKHASKQPGGPSARQPPGSFVVPCAGPAPGTRVIEIRATVPATKAHRDKTARRSDAELKSSRRNDLGLDTNTPAILVRGCNEVRLTAVTVPPDQPVVWSVTPNENTGSPPALTPTSTSTQATLRTDRTGAFPVTATVFGSKVVWNVIFVWVKVKLEGQTITTQSDKYGDHRSDGTNLHFESGAFGQPNYPWEATVSVQLIGGGANGTRGIDKVSVHVLQNGIADTLTGNYRGGGTAVELPPGGLPVLDSNDASTPFFWKDEDVKVTPDQLGKDRTIWIGDAPTGEFPRVHKNTQAPLETISGINAFATAIASVSVDAPNAIVLHAMARWVADFAGDNTRPGSELGTYKPKSPYVHTYGDDTFSLISEATGGQDAWHAGFETFEPRFNIHKNNQWTP